MTDLQVFLVFVRYSTETGKIPVKKFILGKVASCWPLDGIFPIPPKIIDAVSKNENIKFQKLNPKGSDLLRNYATSKFSFSLCAFEQQA